MKGFYRLLNHEFAAWSRAIVLLSIGVLGSPLLLLHFATKDYASYTVHERYETVYMSSGSAIVFLVYVLALCAFFLKSIYADYWGSKGIYTYLTLPVRREAVYFSKLAIFAMCLLLLLAVQLISIRLGYALVALRSESDGDVNFVMNNGLFLSFIRSDFFRLLLPFNAHSILSTISILIALITGFYYGALCERSKRRWGFLPLNVAIAIVVHIIANRLNELINPLNSVYLYWTSGFLLAFSGYFMWHSIRWMKSGAIA